MSLIFSLNFYRSNSAESIFRVELFTQKQMTFAIKKVNLATSNKKFLQRETNETGNDGQVIFGMVNK